MKHGVPALCRFPGNRLLDRAPRRRQLQFHVYEKTPLGNSCACRPITLTAARINAGTKLDWVPRQVPDAYFLLNVISDLHQRYASLDAKAWPPSSTRRATSSATGQSVTCAARGPPPDADARSSDGAPLSANPTETFFTGGGVHTASPTSSMKTMDDAELGRALSNR